LFKTKNSLRIKGAFLVPWLLCIVLCGIPLFVLEVSLGQYLNTGGIGVWNLVPLFKGIGYASMVMIGLCNIYYIVLIAWTLFYFVASFDQPLPWSHCHAGNRFCLDLGAANATFELVARNLSKTDLRIVSPVKDYWE
jgi:solute carrier family 6 GABA transporter-like protein 1